MAKLVKKTYGKKFAWETGSSHAFDEAKLQSKSSPSKIIRPSIWAKVPLVETFVAEPPPRLKKRVLPTTNQDTSDGENTDHSPKKGRKRKIQDPFGFGDFDDEVLPASEYISPKRKRSLEMPNGVTKSKAKKLKMKGNPEPMRFSNNYTPADHVELSKLLSDTPSPKKRGRPPKHSIDPVLSPLTIRSVSMESKGNMASPSPKKRGRPPKHSIDSVLSHPKSKSVAAKVKGIVASPSPKKRGRPPKHLTESVLSPTKNEPASIKVKALVASPSPKKRGRPPKHLTESVLSPIKSKPVSVKVKALVASPSPKKRGRPPKHLTESVLSPTKSKPASIKVKALVASPNPKKRGRPPKHLTESVLSPTKSEPVSVKGKTLLASPSPKKRGRPPKNAIASVMSPLADSVLSTKAKGSMASPSPKKRGRPPKNSIASVVSPLADSVLSTKAKGSMASPSPKKRGRPPKNSIASVVSPLAYSVLSTKATMATPSPKKRGRPSKSILQLPASPLKDTSKAVTQGQKVASPSPKKRGRPPKDSMQSPLMQLQKISNLVTLDKSPIVQKKRGRPPKIQNAVGPTLDTTISLNEKSSEFSPRKVGRPPKSKIMSPKATKDTGSPNPRKRGRPPKTPVPISLSNSNSQASSQSVDSDGASTTSSQKWCGRLPKISKQGSSASLSSSSLETQTQPQKDSGLVPKRRGRPPKSSSTTSTYTANLEKGREPLISDTEMKDSQLIAKNLNESDMIQENDSVVDSNSVIQVINEAPLIENKHGRKTNAKITEINEGDSPASTPNTAQDTASSTDGSGSQLSIQPSSSTESTSLNRRGMDADSSADQTDNEDFSKKIESSMDTAKSYNDIETSPFKAGPSMVSGSPFKWFLKNNEKTLSPRKVVQFRRMSVLPTCTPQKGEDDDDTDGGLGAIPFSLSWVMQQDDNAVRVSKDDKELFTIVRNTKQAQESVEFGESQQFKDDVEYLLDGISETSSLSTRCLSLIELASKCSKSAFRMNLRAHGTINAIFERLSDAPTYQNLALCTASVMFMLTRDRLSIDFDKSILEIMLKLLAMEDKNDEMNSKEWDKLTSKIRAIFEKHEIKGVTNLNLSKLTTESLARESLLSLTSQRTGSWFKDEIRILGGLDHVVDTVVSCSKCLKVDGKVAASDSSTNMRQIERCLKLLENVTVQCQTNQGYLTSYRDSALLETCSRLLMFSVAFLTGGDCYNKAAVQALWFSTMKTLLNLTHDNELASVRFCQKSNVLSILLKSALQLPSFLPSPKQFDVVVLSLGLLINLVEYSKKNLLALNAAVAPPQLSSSEEYTACSDNDDTPSLESLLHLFMVKLEAAKDNSGMEEDLTKLNSSLHNSSIRIGSDGVSLVCGDDLDRSANDESSSSNAKSDEEGKQAEEQEPGDSNSAEKASKKTSSEKEAEHLGKALEKAGQHMEDSLIASYAALLVALLCEENKENQQIVHEKLQYGDFGIMTHTLDKFLAFMNMTASSSSSSSAVVIKRAIGVLEQCKSEFPASLPVVQTSST